MSKSPNIMLPAIGVTSLVIAVAYVAGDKVMRDYETQSEGWKIEQLEAQVTSLKDQNTTLKADNVKIQKDAEAAVKLAAQSGHQEISPTVGALPLGRDATANEIAAWDIDVRPDGQGLPVGSGDVWTGEEVFVEKCASCHGDFAEGVDRWPVLAGGIDSLTDDRPVKTVGSYWPYLSTVWDYVHRAMPFGNAQSLTDDEVYAITAYILYSNDLVDDDFTLSDKNFLDVRLPNENAFYMDDRETTEYTQFRSENVCMTDCKSDVEITMRAAVLDVTPKTDDETDAAMTQDHSETNKDAAQTTESAPVFDAALAATGEKVFKKCKACHKVGDGAKNGTGPMLNGIVNAPAGQNAGFASKYSKALTAAGENGLIWTDENLAAFLAKPKKYLRGTKMSFNGLKKEKDVQAVIEYLKSFPNQ